MWLGGSQLCGGNKSAWFTSNTEGRHGESTQGLTILNRPRWMGCSRGSKVVKKDHGRLFMRACFSSFGKLQTDTCALVW